MTSIGDVVSSIEGLDVVRQGQAVFRVLNEKVNQQVKVRVRRGGSERELDMKVAAREEVTYQIVEDRAPTPQQMKIREGWLKRNGTAAR